MLSLKILTLHLALFCLSWSSTMYLKGKFVYSNIQEAKPDSSCYTQMYTSKHRRFRHSEAQTFFVATEKGCI